MSKTYFQIDGFNKLSEQDDFEKGCLPKTGSSFWVDYTLQSPDLKTLIDKAKEFLGIDDDKNVLLNSCEEMGRIDFHVMETAAGYAANSADMENWKRGNLRLWSCTYTAQVSLITEQDWIDLKDHLEAPSLYSCD